MAISQFVWSDDRIAHIARHNVVPEEFEEVCFGVVSFPDGKGYPVTSRDMTDAEKRRYEGWKRP